MKTRAAVAFEAKQPLEIVEVDLEGPKQGEVLVEIMATGICHTDAYTLDGLDSEGLFPSILGHKAPAWSARSVQASPCHPRRPRHPFVHARMPPCKSCLSARPFCAPHPRYPGQGVMPDGTSRFSYKGSHPPLYGLLDLLQLHRFARDCVANPRDAPFKTSCYIGVRVTTGSARWSTPPRSRSATTWWFSASVGIGLNVIQGARSPARSNRRVESTPRARKWVAGSA